MCWGAGRGSQHLHQLVEVLNGLLGRGCLLEEGDDPVDVLDALVGLLPHVQMGSNLRGNGGPDECPFCAYRRGGDIVGVG